MYRDDALKYMKSKFTHVKFALKKDEQKVVIGTFLALVDYLNPPNTHHSTPNDYRVEWIKPINDVGDQTLLYFFTGNEFQTGQVFTKILKEI